MSERGTDRKGREERMCQQVIDLIQLEACPRDDKQTQKKKLQPIFLIETRLSQVIFKCSHRRTQRTVSNYAKALNKESTGWPWIPWLPTERK